MIPRIKTCENNVINDFEIESILADSENKYSNVNKRIYKHENFKKNIKPITVLEISNIIDFLNKLSLNIKFQFEAKLIRNFIRNSIDTIRNKMSLHEYIKENKVQQYILSYKEKSLKDFIESPPQLPRSEFCKNNTSHVEVSAS